MGTALRTCRQGLEWRRRLPRQFQRWRWAAIPAAAHSTCSSQQEGNTMQRRDTVNYGIILMHSYDKPIRYALLQLWHDDTIHNVHYDVVYIQVTQH